MAFIAENDSHWAVMRGRSGFCQDCRTPVDAVVLFLTVSEEWSLVLSSENPSEESATQALRPEKARVTFCINELDPGGAEKALVRVAAGLLAKDWQVNVVSLRDLGALAEPLVLEGIPVVALGCGGLLDVRAIFRLRRVLRQQRPDVLVCFLHQANIVGRISGWLARVPTVVSGIRVADRRSWVVWTDRITRGLSRHYVAVSRHVADVHAALCRIPRDRVTVIPNGVDVPEIQPLPADREDSQFRILFVGRLTRQKRPQSLIRAVAALPEGLRDRTVLDLLGDGELRAELQNQIDSLGLADRIRLHGQQSDVPDWMVQSDVLVLPSEWEGLPNVILEAMARGLPVIATAVDGVSEIIEHEQTGWMVPPGNVSALAESLAMVSADEDLRNVVANRAFDAVRQRFRWDKTIDAFDELLSGLVERLIDVQKHT